LEDSEMEKRSRRGEENKKKCQNAREAGRRTEKERKRVGGPGGGRGGEGKREKG
jgi:hypothetical protein